MPAPPELLTLPGTGAMAPAHTQQGNPMSAPELTDEPLQQRTRAMTHALREWDPDAEVQFESANGRLSILTTLAPARVREILATVGEHVEDAPEEPQRGGGCGCGGCGCSG